MVSDDVGVAASTSVDDVSFEAHTNKARYEKLAFLGEGQFANVYKARVISTGEIVAIKKIKMGTRDETADGMNRTAIREIKLQQEIDHPNVVRLLDVMASAMSVSMVLPFMDTDMERIIRDDTVLLLPQHIKNMMAQTLQGLMYLHNSYILHRDMKPNNLLINKAGLLKIADFGLARYYGSPHRIYSHQVVTRWYRAPELLMGARHYGVGVDMWATGCILAELLLRKPLFQGESDLDQISKICAVLGTPTEEYWPHMTSLPDYFQMTHQVGVQFSELFAAASPDVLSVMYNTFAYDPNRRMSAFDLLSMPYFQSEEPRPCSNADLPLGLDDGERRRRERHKRQAIMADDKRAEGEAGPVRKKLMF